MYNTRFFGRYDSQDALIKTHKNFYDICLELSNFGHMLKLRDFREDSNSERADADCLLANYTPIVSVDVQAIKWTKEGKGEIALNIRHLQNKKFPELEEIAGHYGLSPEGTKDLFANRRSGIKK